MRVTVRAVSVLMLLLLLAILARVAPRRNTSASSSASQYQSSIAVQDPAEDRGSTGPAEPAPAAIKNAPDPIPARAPLGLELSEGVLFEFEGVSYLYPDEIPDPQPYPIAPESRDPGISKYFKNPVVDGPLLKGLRKGNDNRFGRFLQGDDVELPPAFVHLVVELQPIPPEAQNPTTFFEQPGPPKAREVRRLIEVEVFGDPWLEAWRSLHRAACEVETRLADSPGPEKRTRIIPAIANLKSALDRAKQARAGDAVVHWRVRAETACVEPVAKELSWIGMAEELAWGPSTSELARAFLNSKTQTGLRESIVGRWGESVLARGVQIRADDFRGITGASGRITFDRILDLPADDFTRMREQIGFLAELDGVRSHNSAGYILGPFPDSIGLQVEDASAEERFRFVLGGAALVREVTPCSPGAIAGFLVGDAIWKVTVFGTNAHDIELNSEPCVISGRSVFRYALGGADSVHGRVQFDVIRDGSPVELEIPLPGLSDDEKRRSRELQEDLFGQ